MKLKKNKIRQTFLIFLLSLIFAGIVGTFSACSKKQKQDQAESGKQVDEVVEKARVLEATGEPGDQAEDGGEKSGENSWGQTISHQGATEQMTDALENSIQEETTQAVGEVGVVEGENSPSDLEVQTEEERIADEIATMEEEFSGDQKQGEAPEELSSDLSEIEKSLNSENLAKELTDKSENLKFMEYDKEVFIPQKTADGYIIIHSENGNVIRNFYDLLYRLTTKENWTIKTAASATLNQTDNYEYKDDTYTILKKTTASPSQEKTYIYTENGLISDVFEYIIINQAENNDKKNNQKSKKSKSEEQIKKLITASRKTSYNDENKVSEEESVDYTYDQDYEKLLYTFSKKYKYFYNQDDIPPDFEYFEDGILKMKNKYSTVKGDYTSQIYFENDFSVKTYYENNIRTKDCYYSGENLIRTKIYDQKTDSQES